MTTSVNDIIGFFMQRSGLYSATKLDAGFVCSFPFRTNFAGFKQ